MSPRLNSKLAIAGLAIIALMTGCQGGQDGLPPGAETRSEPGIQIVPGAQPTEEEQQALLAARDALFEQLSGRLLETMSSEGPAAAIKVCQQEAPQIAERVGAKQGVKIGRTGVRLRNPANQAPAWAAGLIERKSETPTFVTLTNQHAAALLPIKLKAQCLLCHGPEDQIPADVRTQLALFYPGDAATGFREGELRGWFWVERLE